MCPCNGAYCTVICGIGCLAACALTGGALIAWAAAVGMTGGAAGVIAGVSTGS